jgi:Kdo2-lipid IVA lauroyltransferase/acyltransferase
MARKRLLNRFPRLRRWVRRSKSALTYWLVRGVIAALRPLSLERALRLADHIGDLIFRFANQTRRLALQHLELALGDELPAATRERIARACFRNMARFFCEVAKSDQILPQIDKYVEIEGWENAEKALAGGKGGIVLTGHIGNWELMGARCARAGVRVAAVARRMHDPDLNAMLTDFRSRCGIETILRESPGSSRQILKVLGDNGILALLIDQDTRAPSISVPFFGRMARTPAAAATLAVRRGLPVVPVFMRRRPEGGHCMSVLEPIYPPADLERQRAVLDLTRQFSLILEERIRKNPAEWVWWHRRWRRPPQARLDLDAEIQYPLKNSVLP